MANDSYLQVDGVKGESADSGHSGWIEILSYEQQVIQPASATVNSAGGGTTSRCQHADFVITKYHDLSSAKLFELCCQGKHIKKVVIELMRASGDAPVKYLAIELDNVVISRFNSHKNPDDDLPVETVAFNYAVIKKTHTQQKRADGSKGGNVVGGWDLQANKTAA